MEEKEVCKYCSEINGVYELLNINAYDNFNHLNNVVPDNKKVKP